MNKRFLEGFDQTCYEIFKTLIGMIGLVCGLLISWVSLAWSIGCFVRLEIGEGFLALLVSLLSIVIWRGSGKLYETINEK